MFEFIKELNSCGIDATITEMELFNREIPLYISALYVLYTGEIQNMDVIFIIPRDTLTITPDQLKKQLQVITERTRKLPVVVLKSLPAYNINRFVSKGINFIVGGKQFFLPDLMISLKKQNSQKTKSKESLSGQTQMLLLYHLQKNDISGLTTKEISNLVGSSYLSISRSLKELQDFGLIKMEGGKEKITILPKTGKELWKEASIYLQSPIEKSVLAESLPDKSQIILSGLNALSHYSNLNDTQRQYYALSRNDYRKILGEVTLNPEYGNIELQQWRYDPAILQQNGYVDPLSVYLMYRENEDERIQIELEKIIDEYKWLTD